MLEVKKLVDNQYPDTGSIVTYKIIITNNGTVTATNVKVIDIITSECPGIIYIANSLTIDGVPSTVNPFMGISIDNISPSETVYIQFSIMIEATQFQKCCKIENVAEVTYDYNNIPQITVLSNPVTIYPNIINCHCEGQILEIVSVTIPKLPAKVDVVFCLDLTSSMASILDNAKKNVAEIIKKLKLLGIDIQYGVTSHMDYPEYYDDYHGYSNPYGYGNDYPYRMNQSITSSVSLITSAINNLKLGDGADSPESYTRVFYESYADSSLGWRTASKRIFVHFGDDVPHDDNLNEYIPGMTDIWSTGGDPGRNEQPNDEDDLDLQTVLKEMKKPQNNIILIECRPSSASYIDYWNYWTSITGGSVEIINSTTFVQDVVDAITNIITEENIYNLHLETSIGYEAWLKSVTPPSYSGSTGVTVKFNVIIESPVGTECGKYCFSIFAKDSNNRIYSEDKVCIDVRSDNPDCCCIHEKINSLYNTGVDNSGKALKDNTKDPHYNLISSPYSEIPPVPVAQTGYDTTYPLNVWLPETPTSRWIMPGGCSLNGSCSKSCSQTEGCRAGNYIYQTQFDLTDFNLSTVQIKGKWATDNEGVDIILNSTSLGFQLLSDKSWSKFEEFIIDTYTPNVVFNQGINTLQFKVHNDLYTDFKTPTGLRVEMEGTGCKNKFNITKFVDKKYTKVGEYLTYTIIVTNPGPTDITNFRFIDNLVYAIEIENIYTDIVVTPFKLYDNNSNKNRVDLNFKDTLYRGETIIITIKTKVVSLYYNLKVLNNASIKYENTLSTSNTVATEIQCVIPWKDGNKPNVGIGDSLTYTIEAVNNMDVKAENVIIQDTIPEGVTFIANSVRVNGILIPGVNPLMGINIGSLDPNGTSTVTFDVKVTTLPSTILTPSIVNTSNINYYYILDNVTPPIQITSSSNTVITNIKYGQITPEDVKQTTNRINTTPGDIITYTISAKNSGNVDIDSLTITDALPVGTTFILQSVTINGEVDLLADPTTGININTLPSDETVEVTFKVKVNEESLSVLTNQANIEYSYRVDDTQPSKYETLQVYFVGIDNVIPNMDILKNSENSSATVGEIVTYTIIVLNNGAVSLDNICISDILSPSLRFIDESVTIDGNYCADSILNCVNLKSLDVDESKVIKFKAEVLSSSINPIENTANVTFDYMVEELGQRKGSLNSNTYKLSVENANIDVVKNANKDFVVLGDTITYTVNVINSGSLDVLNVIFKDEMQYDFELLGNIIKIDSSVVNITKDILKTGMNIGSIEKGKTVTIEYSVKVTEYKCSSELTNFASVKFSYILSDNTARKGESKSTPNSSTKVTLGATNFKQMSIQEYLNIPDSKDSIEEINNVSSKIDIIKSHVIKTNQIISNEGQKVSNYKLIIRGSLSIIVEYTTCEPSQELYSINYNIPFSSFIILPSNYKVGSKCDIAGFVEDIYYSKIDSRKFFINATALISTKILSC